MTTIYLIRHGQASAGAENYDVLSPTGRRQAAVLGDHFRDITLDFNNIYSGNLERQIDTATIALNCSSENLKQSHHFDEYHHKQIFGHYLPLLAKKNKAMSDAATAGPNTLMTMEVFTELMNAWTTDQSGTAPIESWPTFKARVMQGINNIAASNDAHDQVAVFTSGGVICTILQSIFDSTPKTAFEMNWGINNAGITRIKADCHNTLQLREYNNISHLQLQKDKTLITQI